MDAQRHRKIRPQLALAHRDAGIDRHVERARHREVFRRHRGQGTGEILFDGAAACALAAGHDRIDSTARIARKSPQSTDVTHCLFDPRAGTSRLGQGQKSGPMHELIRDITLCILFAWVLGLLAHFSRQPLILAYLIAGFFIGPFGMGWVKSQELINVISELGLIFMLFMIGLEIDLKKIVRAGKVILFAAGGQLIGGCLLGMLFFIGHRAVDGRRPFRRALSLRRLRAVEHGHHRQGAVREARARHAARAHHARRAGAAGHLRDPVPGGAAEPRQSAGQRDPALDRPRRRAGGDRAGA